MQILRDTDIRNADRAELRDIENVILRSDLPPQERLENYIEQIGNPYCFKCGKYVVKLSFTEDGDTLKDRLRAYLDSRRWGE